MTDPYDQDEEAERAGDVMPPDSRRVGTARGAMPTPGTMPVGPGRRPVDRAATQRVGTGFTPLGYDPRRADSIGTGLTRLDYRPTAALGTSGKGPLDEVMCKAVAENDRNSCEWLPGWIEWFCSSTGNPPPGWARSVFAALGRPDLVQWCASVDAALAQQRR